jgi:PAS domain S-box-containing protein
MKVGPIPKNEAERISALHKFQILDTEAEREFDDIVELASRICETPISLITFIDEKRQWFKANRGLAVSETSREVAFCAHAINHQDLMLVTDATQDERFFDNPFVKGDPNIRFYAGIPLLTDDGLALGTLCVIDQQPRTLTSSQAFALRVLGKNVVALLKLRAAKRELNAIVTALPVFLFRFDKENRFIYSHAHDPTDLLLRNRNFIGRKIEEVLPPEFIRLISKKIKLARHSGEMQIFEQALDLPSGQVWYEARVFKANNEDVIAILRDVTTSKRNEEEKLRSFKFIQTVSDNVPALISHWTTDLACTFVNEKHVKWFGQKKEDMLGRSMQELIDKEIFHTVDPFVKKALAGESQDFQLTTPMEKGRDLFVRVQFIPDIVQGNVTGFFSLVTNITKIKQVEESYRKEKELSNSIINNLPGIFYLFDYRGKILRWNKNFETISGYGPEEIKRMHPSKFVDAGNRKKFRKRIVAVFEGEIPGAEITFCNKENKLISFYINSLALTYGGVPCVLGIGIDLTDRLNAELKLRNTLKELTDYKHALNQSSIISITDNNGVITYANDNFCKTSKFSLEEVLGKTHRIVSSGYHPDTFFADLWKTIKSGNIWNGEIKNRAKDGTHFWVNTTTVPFKDQNGEPYQYLAIRTDITGRKRVEEALRKSEANLRTIFENSGIAFIRLNEKLEVISFNQLAQAYAKQYLPIALEEGRNGFEYFSNRKANLEVALSGEVSRSVENYSMDSEIPFWLLEKYLPVFDDDKNVVGLIITYSDISILKRAESAVKENEQRLSNILNNMIGGIVEVDTKGNFKFLNESAKQILGLEPSLFIDSYNISSFAKSFDLDENPLAAENFPINTVLARHTTVNNFELGLKTKGGITKWLTMNAAPAFSEEGILSGAVCSFMDITENIEAQNELKEVSSRLMLAKQSAGFGLWELDIDTGKITWDEQMYRLTGLDPNTEITNPVFLSHVHPEDVQREKRRLEGFTKDYSGRDGVFRFIRNDSGSIRYLRKNTVIRYNGKGQPKHVLGIVYDVSGIILHEQSLMEANQKAEEMKQIALRAAMNPHFLFNALNSIQFFITHNDRTNAINYLSKFSKLVRGILNSSMNKTTRLSVELELLRHYIEIEQIRFSHKFNFDIELQEDIDTEAIEVPSLLLQPFVENAILHGLYNKEIVGQLKILIRQETNTLTIFIEDNGIGREAANQLRTKNFPAHQSNGILITKERMKLFDGGSISSRIQDLYDDGKPSGTRVIIRMKVG